MDGEFSLEPIESLRELQDTKGNSTDFSGGLKNPATDGEVTTLINYDNVTTMAQGPLPV